MEFPELNIEAFQEATSWRLRASFPREGAPWRNQVGPERSMISQAKGRNRQMVVIAEVPPLVDPYPDWDR